ncbi:MAG: DUF1015 domain-containing protein [Dehalococcoidia bacterium]
MADVRPLQAIRYAPSVDLAAAVCPPFDTISPREQDRLYASGPHNAVRLELPRAEDDPYASAAGTLRGWLGDGALVRDGAPAFYVYEQEFRHAEETYRRRVLFARVRLQPWASGAVLPHERTFSAPKEDRLNLLRALRLNTSPVFLLYRDDEQHVQPLVARAVSSPPAAAFADGDGLSNGLWRVDDETTVRTITRAFERETLYVADGHHRYETALAYADELGAGPDAAERFALVALTAVEDPGLLVLPTHRLAACDLPVDRAIDALSAVFDVETRPSLPELMAALSERGRMLNCFGLLARGSPEFYLLSLYETAAVDPYLPQERPPIWRQLDTAVADHVILRYALGLSEDAMNDYDTVWFEEDAAAALAEVREGEADYALLLNSIPPRKVLAVADAGERMPQKSTFFYPKIPTGLVFNPLFG